MKDRADRVRDCADRALQQVEVIHELVTDSDEVTTAITRARELIIDAKVAALNVLERRRDPRPVSDLPLTALDPLDPDHAREIRRRGALA